MIRVYLMPMTMQDISGRQVRAPKYFSELDAEHLRWQMVDYALEPVCLIRVENPSSALQASLAGKNDVITFPRAMTDRPTQAQIDAITPKLEAANIPAHWITTGMSYRTIARKLYGIFTFNQRFIGWAREKLDMSYSSVFDAVGRNLDSTYDTFPAQVKTLLNEVRLKLNLDPPPTGADTKLRDILAYFGMQYMKSPFDAL